MVHASVAPEPFGLVIVEAMACGTPVVASRLGGPNEIIRHGIDGFLVEPTDPKAIALKIQVVLDDPKMKKQIAQRAIKRVEDCFSLEAFTTAFMQLYAEL